MRRSMRIGRRGEFACVLWKIEGGRKIPCFRVVRLRQAERWGLLFLQSGFYGRRLCSFTMDDG